MEVSNILQTKAYELSEEKNIPAIKNGYEGRFCM